MAVRSIDRRRAPNIIWSFRGDSTGKGRLNGSSERARVGTGAGSGAAQALHEPMLNGFFQPKSSGPNRGRMSMSESVSIGFGHLFTHSTASSSDFTSQSQ